MNPEGNKADVSKQVAWSCTKNAGIESGGLVLQLIHETIVEISPISKSDITTQSGFWSKKAKAHVDVTLLFIDNNSYDK